MNPTMNPTMDEQLLTDLGSGDPAVVERVFRHYEPFLRIVVRRMIAQRLRAKLDSVDVVQSVWADVWEGLQQGRWSFDRPEQLKAFLVAAARHRLIDQSRRYRRALQLEQPLDQCASEASDSSTPRPIEQIEAEELWQQWLERCSPRQRAILSMKRSGASLQRIADSQGMHKSSVRRVIYQLAQRLLGHLPATSRSVARSS